MKKIIFTILIVGALLGGIAYANSLLLLGVGGSGHMIATYERLYDSTGTSLEDNTSEPLYSTEY